MKIRKQARVASKCIHETSGQTSKKEKALQRISRSKPTNSDVRFQYSIAQQRYPSGY